MEGSGLSRLVRTEFSGSDMTKVRGRYKRVLSLNGEPKR